MESVSNLRKEGFKQQGRDPDESETDMGMLAGKWIRKKLKGEDLSKLQDEKPPTSKTDENTENQNVDDDANQSNDSDVSDQSDDGTEDNNKKK